LKSKISVLKKENKQIKEDLEKSESEKKFQKDLYESQLNKWAEKNFKLRNWFIVNDKIKELEKIEYEVKGKLAAK
tara:strand:+ start:85 stop:309 length:225 start_codon:yes stop_codon:yes gene_type:complete